MPPDFTRRLGYGGSAVVDGVQVLITGGSMERADTPSFLEMLDIDPTVGGDVMSPRSKVFHADGVSVFTGSLSFDVTAAIMAKIAKDKLLGRGYKFNIGINDGENDYVMSDCYATSLSLSGAPGGLIAASLSVMAKSSFAAGAVTNDYILEDYTSTTDNQPLGYWWSGGTDIKEWTLNMSQTVEPVYLNQNQMTPQYLRVGLIEYSLDTVLYDELTPSVVHIRTKTFTLKGKTTAKGYSFNGVTDLGTYSHSFTTAADMTTGSDDDVLQVT